MALGFTTSSHTVLFLNVIALCLFYLCDEVVETLTSLFILHFTNLFPVFLRHAYSHFCQIALFLVHRSIKNLFFSIHVIIAVEVDRLCSRCCILQVLLHTLDIKFLALLLRQSISPRKLIASADDSILGSGSLLTRFTNHSFSLAAFIVIFIISDALVYKIGDKDGAEGKNAHHGRLLRCF